MVVHMHEAYEDAIRECTAALGLKPEYMKALMRRSETHEHLEHQEDALAGVRCLGIPIRIILYLEKPLFGMSLC